MKLRPSFSLARASKALDKAELARALKLTVAGPARERVDALVDDMFAQADADEDGAISFDEFVAMHERVFEVVAERGRADARGAAAPPRAGGEFDDLDPEMAKSGRVAPAS